MFFNDLVGPDCFVYEIDYFCYPNQYWFGKYYQFLSWYSDDRVLTVSL